MKDEITRLFAAALTALRCLLSPRSTAAVTDAERLEDLAADLAMLSDRLDTLAANSWGADSAENLVQSIWESGYRHANDRLVHRLDALEVRLEEIETALRDVLAIAPYLRTFSERVTALEEKAGHPYAA